MQALHNFMDRMREKPVGERRKLRFVSTVILGVIIVAIGIWNISSRLVVLSSPGPGSENNLAATGVAGSSGGGASLAGLWSAISGGLQSLNDKLGAQR